ncbi:hypothetical protein ABH15_00875 [Methanoculleus taiwanensis]|uniref:Uncharacterized protein n=1 Tax=Methanoculleus taiwanensis TaxID=1550565 RepID=A0A498H407_9EURY|nr:hypothetical protein ABH15_00875 [Methanoculleus taiwanensis]
MDKRLSFIRVCQSSGCSDVYLSFGIFLGVLMVDGHDRESRWQESRLRDWPPDLQLIPSVLS